MLNLNPLSDLTNLYIDHNHEQQQISTIHYDIAYFWLII